MLISLQNYSCFSQLSNCGNQNFQDDTIFRKEIQKILIHTTLALAKLSNCLNR
jgi:hypothetical protein